MPKPDSGAQKMMLVALGCAAISGLAFFAASQQSKPVPVAQDKGNLRGCLPNLPGIARYPTAIRGTTKLGGWLVFDQRSLFSDPKLNDIEATDVPGGKAGAIQITRREAMAHDIGTSMRNQRAVLKGEIVIAEVWLRARPTDVRQVPIVIEARIQEDGDGFQGLANAEITLTPKFTKYEMSATALRNYCPKDLNFALHLATGAQTVDVGPATLKVMP
jgi:hypothetical protein